MPSYLRGSGESITFVKVNPGAPPPPSFDSATERDRLDSAWEPLRWTKRLVQRTIASKPEKPPTQKLTPPQRVALQKKTYQASLAALTKSTAELHATVEKLEKDAEAYSSALIEERVEAAAKTMAELKPAGHALARKLSFKRDLP